MFLVLQVIQVSRKKSSGVFKGLTVLRSFNMSLGQYPKKFSKRHRLIWLIFQILKLLITSQYEKRCTLWDSINISGFNSEGSKKLRKLNYRKKAQICRSKTKLVLLQLEVEILWASIQFSFYGWRKD